MNSARLPARDKKIPRAYPPVVKSSHGKNHKGKLLSQIFLKNDSNNNKKILRPPLAMTVKTNEAHRTAYQTFLGPPGVNNYKVNNLKKKYI